MDSAHTDQNSIKKPAVSTQRLDEAIERGDQAPPSLLNHEVWTVEEK